MQGLLDDSAKRVLPKLPRTPGHYCCVTLAGPQLRGYLDGHEETLVAVGPLVRLSKNLS